MCFSTVNTKAPFTRYNRLSNRLWKLVKCLYTWYNRSDNQLYDVYKHSTGCQTRLRLSNPFDNQFDNWLYCVYSWLSNRLYNPVWQPVERTAVRSTWLSNRVWQLVEQQWLFVQHGCRTGCETDLTTGQTGWMFVYTIQPVVKPVVQPVWQPDVSCKRGINKSHYAHAATSNTLLRQLHWFPINFKTANITFHTLHSSQPACLYSALHAHHSTCALRLSNSLFHYLHPHLERCSYEHLEFSSSNMQCPRHFSSSYQEPVFPALSFLHLRFGFCWPLCAFINHIYLIT